MVVEWKERIGKKGKRMGVEMGWMNERICLWVIGVGRGVEKHSSNSRSFHF